MNMKRFMNKKVVAIGLAAGLTLGAAGAAFAYFTSTGSGTGQGSVGTASTWGVTAGAVQGGPIYPNAGSETITYTIKNNSSGAQALDTAVASVNADSNGYVTNQGVSVTGCKASWFTAVAAAPASGFGDGNSIAGGTTTTDVVTVTMQDSGTNQNLCELATPDINLNVT